MFENLWAVVLAGGEGSRVRHLTTDRAGRPVPKQYASPDGGESILRRTLSRATRLVLRERVVVVVARHHRDFWETELADLPPWNVIVQPSNRGTGIGLLLGLLHVLARDPGCGMVVLPSDHHVDDEEALRRGLRRAVRHAGDHGRPTLLGFRPDTDGAELGWILAGEGPRAADVVRFVEKPEPSLARQLAGRGALVNSMILATGGEVLVTVFREIVPRAVERMEAYLEAARRAGGELDALYETLPMCDLSRDILQRAADQMAVVPSPRCGWTDIGTPTRLGRVFGGPPAGAPCVA